MAFSHPLDVGLDPGTEALHEADARKAYIHAVQADGAIQPFEDRSLGGAISNSVLEHIPHIQEVLNELGRVTVPGSLFIFCTPNHRFNDSLWGTGLFRSLGLKRMAAAYIRFYNHIARHEYCDSPETWQDRLAQAGFELPKPGTTSRRLRCTYWSGGTCSDCHPCSGGKSPAAWILVRRRWNLVFPWLLTRRYLDDPICADGTMSFYIARRKGVVRG